MTIESFIHLRRLARISFSAFVVVFSLFAVANAQTAPPPAVATGSIVPLNHAQFGQIYTIRVAPTGDVVFLDVSESQILQMRAGTNQFTTILNGSPLGAAGNFWNEGMAMDATGTIYIGARYPGYNGQEMLRIPYDPKTGTWDNNGQPISASANFWGTNIDLAGGSQMSSTELQFINSSKNDGSGTLIVGTQGGNSIVAVPVNADGSTQTGSNGAPVAQTIVSSLVGPVLRLAVDTNGNIYFLEDPVTSPTGRETGLFFIPASVWQGQTCGLAANPAGSPVACVVGDGNGAAESNPKIERIDPTSNTEQYKGVTVDGEGNLILTDEVDSYGGTMNGIFLLPNESGSTANITPASFNWSDMRYIAPIFSNTAVTVDPRGFLWVPTGTSGWSPGSENAVPGTDNFVAWQMGDMSIGWQVPASVTNSSGSVTYPPSYIAPSPVGTATASGPLTTVYYSFSTSTPIGGVGFVGDNAADFSAAGTDPNPAPNANPPAQPCMAGKTYEAQSSCPVWVTQTPALPGLEGSELTLTDPSGNVIAGSTAYVSGVGLGPDVSLLVPANQTAIAAGLSTPQEVATDANGNSYVADSGLGQVLEFAASATAGTAGTPIGKFTKPTGVAVDPAGNVFVADSGKVYEIPMGANGTLNTAGQTVLSSGALSGSTPTAYSNGTKLAADGSSAVYVADPGNARVVKIPNPSFIYSGTNPLPVGSGFKDPTAIATDNYGDVFIADGATLYEITEPFSGQASITKTLVAPVTGLAVDPSGSVYVAQNGGLIRIPYVNSAYNANDDAAIDTTILSPNGVAMDPFGNLYVSDVTKGTPNLFQLNTDANVNFGQVGPFVTTDPADVDVFDIGNAPLSLTGAPVITGTDGPDGEGEFATTPAAQFGCDTTGATPVSTGSYCTIDVTLTATDLGARTATMTVPTNGLNVPNGTPTAYLSGTGAGNLCYTTTTLTLNPATGVSFPGTTTATIATSLNTTPPAGQSNPAGCTPAPSGSVKLTLTPTGTGQSYTFAGTIIPGTTESTATVPAIDLAGGTYTVKATYTGSTEFFGSSAPTQTLTVAAVTPTVTLTEPSGITPINGTYYVPLGSDTTLQVSVISSLGTPSGTVNFMNGSTIADPTQKNVPLNANGQATFNTSNLLAGTYTITAISNSTGTDPNFSSATSNTITFQVVPGTALITANPSSLSTTAGVPVSTTLTVTGLAGYSPTNLQLSCVGASLPKYAECTFTVPTLNLQTTPTAQTIMTISTNVPVNVSAVQPSNSGIAFASLFGLGALGLALRMRRKFRPGVLTAVALLLMGGALIGLSGCTNSGYTHTPPAPHVTTPSGTYNVQVVGTDPYSSGPTTLPFSISFTVK